VAIDVGLPLAALTCAALGILGAGALLRAARGADPPVRGAYRLVAAGLGAGVCGLAATTFLLAIDGGPVSAGRLGPLAAGQLLGVVLLVVGLLRLPGAADPPGAALRQTLDGALLAACALHITWTLFIQPALVRHAHHPAPSLTDARTYVLGIPLLVSLAALGVAGVTAGRARPPRGVLALAAGGVAATVITSFGLLVALRYGGGAVVAGIGWGYAAGMALAAFAVRRADGVVPSQVDLPGSGNILALVPVAAAIIAAIIRMVVFGGTDNVSILIATVVGSLITARQMVANSAARRYAHRLAEREAFFKDMAFTDALTGLANRRHLMRVLDEQAVGGPACVLMAIDLDGFKNVNDMRGHDVGDAVLVEVGRRLRANLRPGDVAARLGGDEFAVLMWSGPDEAFRAAERLLTVLGAAYDMAGSAVFLSASIGLAGCATAHDVPSLLHNADLSLRFAKQRGKSRVERYDAAYDQWMRRRTTVEQELRGAIEREELSLVYQPVFALPDGRPVGVEALVRWHHPTLGQVSPAEFIPIAEESGLVTRVDRWVLHQACHQLSRWIAEGHDPWVSVNISIRELHLPEYVDHVVEVLRAHRVPPERLVLEVTEHAVALDLDEVVDRLAELREVGVRIALDDFGAGYSSLGQLRRLPVDVLKIDKILVVEPPLAPAGRAAPLVGVVVGLGRQLGLDVIAEGVADPAQQEIVSAAGCRLVQGELYGRPMPSEHVEALLAAAIEGASGSGAAASGLRSAATREDGANSAAKRADGADEPVPAPRPAQDMGQVDSAREMRQS
jgi:diguanylate cyclase (GGDEF)-like protein